MNPTCAAVILRSGGVLLACRPDGKWEFPGGPVAPGESPAVALKRCVRDQFGLDAEAGTIALQTSGLVAFLVQKFSGELTLPATHTRTAWVEAQRLLEREMIFEHQELARVIASHRRRERYKGTHPRRFEEKYKELAGDPEAAAKAQARGSTPAGAHVPIMVEEILKSLAPLEAASVLDCTLGWGGHARALARGGGRVVALDRDGEELERTKARLAAEGVRISAVHANFAGAAAALRSEGLNDVDALLADLGVSSMQLDRPDRGLSFKNDGPLDMRMDRSRGVTAARWLETEEEREISRVLAEYGDEPDAANIARELCALRRRSRSPQTTFALAAAVSAAKGLGVGRIVKKDAFSAHPATRTFQAVRIAVNDERAALAALLAALPGLLKPGGRIALLTFHSGEEALVERALREQASRGLWTAAPQAPRRASPEEIRLNPRARSARLWTAARAGVK